MANGICIEKSTNFLGTKICETCQSGNTKRCDNGCTAIVQNCPNGRYNDFLNLSNLNFFSLNGLIPKPYIIKLNYKIKKGKLIIEKNDTQQYNSINRNENLYTIITAGTFYSVNIPFSCALYKKNINTFFSTMNSFTTMATSYMINNNLETYPNKKLNELWKIKLGFNTNDFNFYNTDYYYNYYITKNGYAYDCVRIIAQKIFIWHLINNLSKSYKITIDFEFFQTFYTCIFENLNGVQPISVENINIYFDKYNSQYMPLSYNSIIQKWIDLINKTDDAINILIYKQASYALNLKELETLDLEKLYSIFDYQTVKFRFLDCLSFNYDKTFD